MRSTLVFVIILCSGLELSAQEKTLKIPSIPHLLAWENKPEKYSIEGNTIRIIAGEKTDMFRDPNVTYNTDNVTQTFI